MVSHGVEQVCRLQKTNSAGSRIRNNLIFKLGVDKPNKDDTSGQAPADREPSRGSLLGNVVISHEPLKYDKDEEHLEEECKVEIKTWGIASIFAKKDYQSKSTERTLSSSFSSSASSSCCATEGSRNSRLTFNEEVGVCPIPKREEYSKRIRQRLWPSAEDALKNAERNSLEFASEGWDWRNTLEDDDMYRDTVTNELVHPIHVERLRHPLWAPQR
jgi:hypothetical protein